MCSVIYIPTIHYILQPMSVELIDFAKTIVDRLRLSVDSTTALGNLSSWLCDYTKLDEDTWWSFRDHEMQIDIVNDTCARQVVQKCSQVGLTNVSKRKALAITMISKAKHIMYVGPTSKWTSKFAKTELHPTIDSSPMLKSALNSNAKGTEVIGLGSSFLHLGGTSGAATGAISVPASYIFIDELDFCKQKVVGMYESRLKHAASDEYDRKGVMAFFSTPTVEDFGINAKFKLSDQKYYDVLCSQCDTWYTPDYFRDVFLGGFTDQLGPDGKPNKMIDLQPEDIAAGKYDVANAHMRCPHCLENGVIHNNFEDLCDPYRRQWRAKNPSSNISGRQVYPWDLPKVNTIPSILMQMTSYTDNIADYYNFTLGLPYTDKNNSFLLSPFTCGNYSKWMEYREENAGYGYCIGVDVGRTSHIVVGKKFGIQLHIVYLERFKSSKEKTLGERIVEIAKSFSAKSIVIDGMPDFSSAQYVSRKLPSRIVLACEYTKSKPARKLSNITVNEEQHVVSAYRTGVLTDFLKMHNDKEVLYPNQNYSSRVKQEIEEVQLNLKNTKKIHKKDATGEDVEWFVKSGPDHYAHAISYLLIATRALGDSVDSSPVAPPPLNVKYFATQGKKKKPNKVLNAIGIG